MAKTLEYYFDYMSPTAYVASAIIPGVIERTGATLAMKPMFLGGVMRATGNQPPGTLPVKGKYMGMDLMRCCKRYDLPLHFNPHFPLMNTRIMTGATIRLADDPELQMRFYNAAFKNVWGNPKGINCGDETEFKAAFSADGFDADRLWELGNDSETKAMLRANTEEAVGKGAFGAPTFYVGDEMFFGHDRLDYAEMSLKA